MKRCSSCREEKPFSDFHKNRAQPDGYANQCKICWRKSQKKYLKTPAGKALIARQKARPEYRESQRKYELSEKGRRKQRERYLRVKDTPEEKRRQRQKTKEYRIKHREKYLAHEAIKHRTHTGQMPRANTLQCTNCEYMAAHYHHHLGYSKEYRLSVIPLCVECHKREHWLK